MLSTFSNNVQIHQCHLASALLHSFNNATTISTFCLILENTVGPLRISCSRLPLLSPKTQKQVFFFHSSFLFANLPFVPILQTFFLLLLLLVMFAYLSFLQAVFCQFAKLLFCFLASLLFFAYIILPTLFVCHVSDLLLPIFFVCILYFFQSYFANILFVSYLLSGEARHRSSSSSFLSSSHSFPLPLGQKVLCNLYQLSHQFSH